MRNPSKPYRPNVGMVVFNAQGDVLVGERIQFPGAWQFPQGGIDPGEDPKNAANRELWEEVGIDSAEWVAEYPEWIAYDFPGDLGITGNLKKFRGQTQKWYLYYWNQTAEKCDLDVHEREFLSVRFMPFGETINSIVEFKKSTYQKLYAKFQPIILEFINKRK